MSPEAPRGVQDQDRKLNKEELKVVVPKLIGDFRRILLQTPEFVAEVAKMYLNIEEGEVKFQKAGDEAFALIGYKWTNGMQVVYFSADANTGVEREETYLCLKTDEYKPEDAEIRYSKGGSVFSGDINHFSVDTQSAVRGTEDLLKRLENRPSMQ